MTVNTISITSGPYTGNGTLDEYSYGFRVENKSQVTVYETTDLGVESTLVVDVDYTVNNIGTDGGGTITRLAGNLPTDYEWYIRSNYIETQDTNFTSQGGFFPAVHTAVADKLTFLIQQMLDFVNRGVRISESESSSANLILPSVSARKSKYFLWGPSGEVGVGDSIPTNAAGSYTSLYNLLTTAPQTTGIFINLDSFYSAYDGGGDPIYWDAFENKTNADGINIFDPDALNGWDGTQGTIATTYYDATSGQGTGSGSGCFKRVFRHKSVIYAENGGVVSDGTADDTVAVQACIDAADGNYKSVVLPGSSVGTKLTATLTVRTGAITLTGGGGRIATLLHSGDYGDTINISRSTPLTNRINQVTLENLRFFVDSGATLPTSGAHVHFVRPQACEVRGCDISEGFGGLLCEGGAGVIISDSKINSGQLYGSAQSGSYLAKFIGVATSGAREFPSEYTITNFNWRDSGNAYIENAIVIDSSDGLFFSNGHTGFTSNACCLIEPSVAADSLNGINFTNVHFDGNSATDRGVHYTESSTGFHTGACFGHTFTGCQFSINDIDGLRADIDSMTGLSITGGRCNANGTWGMRFSRGSGFSVKGMLFRSNGTNLAGTGNILCENDVTDSEFNVIHTGTTYRGIQLTGTVDRINVDGIFSGLTAEDVISSSTNLNNKFNGVTDKSNVLASAATLTIPLIGGVFEVSGTTGITAFSGDSRYLGREVELHFQDILTVTKGGTLAMASDFTTTGNDVLVLAYSGSSWKESSRSVN